MEQQQQRKKRDKQETDYNKILVGAKKTRDRRLYSRNEMIINWRLNGSNSIILISSSSKQFNLICMKRITTDPDVNKRKQICTKKKNTEGKNKKKKSIKCQIEITGYEKRPILFAFF
jgi:hypothetical protein